MAVNVVISAAGRCPAAAGGAIEETNRNKRKIGLCLIGFVALSLGVLHDYFTKGVKNNKARQLVLYFWRFSLGVLYALEKVM